MVPVQRSASGSDEPAREVDQKHGASGGYDKPSNEASRVDPENAEDKSAEHRSDDSEQQIDQDTVPAAAHDLTREPAGESSDHNLPHEHHAGILQQAGIFPVRANAWRR